MLERKKTSFVETELVQTGGELNAVIRELQGLRRKIQGCHTHTREVELAFTFQCQDKSSVEKLAILAKEGIVHNFSERRERQLIRVKLKQQGIKKNLTKIPDQYCTCNNLFSTKQCFVCLVAKFWLGVL